MEERSRGDFDAWKENEFEEFWGQKQKVAHTARAGVATNIKLEKLVNQGLFRIGDVWSYVRCFGRGEQAVVVEKDCELIGIKGANLTFEIPGGTEKYSTKLAAVADRADGISSNELPIRSPKATQTAIEMPQVDVSSPHGQATSVSTGDALDVNGKSNDLTLATQLLKQSSLAELFEKNGSSITSSPLSSARSDITDPTDWMREVRSPPMAKYHKQNGYDAIATDSETITYTTRNLGALETKIVNIDGRVQDVPNGNAWKTFRLLRQNQDLGSFFDVRDKYCVDFGI